MSWYNPVSFGSLLWFLMAELASEVRRAFP